MDIAIAARTEAGKPVAGGDETKAFPFPEKAASWIERFQSGLETGQLDEAMRTGIAAVQCVDEFISHTAPFTLAKRVDDIAGARDALGAILYACAEALRIASLMLYPAMPEKMAQLWRLWNCSPLVSPDDCNSAFKAPLAELAQWAHPVHGLRPGQKIAKGEALFMRADPKEPAPTKA